jgi:predicted dehydrogenase
MGVTLAGIYSRTRARAEALADEFGILAVCDSLEELYERTRAELVVITVPELSMRSISEACFEFPWTALLEKPAGYNVPEAEAIAAAAQARNRTALVALNRRFHSSTRQIIAELASVEGQRYVRVQDQEDQEAALSAGQPKEVVDHWMYANSVHIVDYLRLFGRGEIRAVRQVVPWNPDAPGVVIGEVEFSSGDIGIYEGIWNGPGPWSVTVSTPEKRLEMRPLEEATVQLRGERRVQSLAIDPWDTKFKPGFRSQAQHAVAAALGQASDSPELADALETMRLIQRLFE